MRAAFIDRDGLRPLTRINAYYFSGDRLGKRQGAKIEELPHPLLLQIGLLVAMQLPLQGLNLLP